MPKQESALSLVFRWLKTLLTGARCRCPKCQQGSMFQSFYTIRTHCPHCGVKFQPYEGDSLGVYAVCYFCSLIPAMIGFLLAFRYLDLNAHGLLGVFAAVTAVVLFGFYRNMKGLWVACVFLMTGLRPNL